MLPPDFKTGLMGGSAVGRAPARLSRPRRDAELVQLRPTSLGRFAPQLLGHGDRLEKGCSCACAEKLFVSGVRDVPGSRAESFDFSNAC